MSAYTKAFDKVIGHEGGFQNDKRDRGNWTTGIIGEGELKGTKYGISAAAYPHLDIKNLTLEQAKAIYYRDYWQAAGADEYHPAIGYQVFDAAVNHSYGNAARMLQRAAGVADDGMIGPISLSAIKSLDPAILLLGFLGERLRFMARLSKFDTYGRGWSDRVATNLLYAADEVRHE